MVTAGTLVAVTIDGLAYGFFLGLLGVGITLVFGLGEVLNLAIGSFAVIAVLAASTIVGLGGGVLVASIAALAVVAAFGLVVDKALLSFVYRSEGEERILLGIFTTLGLTVLLEGVLTNFYPSRYTVPFQIGSVRVGGASIQMGSVGVIVASVVVLGALYAFLKWTFLGKATRTVFQDERGAHLMGINPRRIRTLIFVLSVVVAGIAGLVFTVTSSASVSLGFRFTVFALIVSIVGGVRSLEGAIAAGVLLGLVNQFANFFIGSYVATVILFLTAIAVLLAKPEEIL